ncbi:cytoplasmic protein [Mycena vulgaris]|nr:cytoplasmic protein [Mycena vulgaris]
MSLVKILTALVNLLCGGSQSAPGETQQPHAPPAQQHQQHQQQQHHQQPQEYPPPHKPPPQQGHAPSPPQHRPEPGHHISDPNQANQHNAHYMRLRAEANEEGDKMAKCFAQSHEAYSRGDGAGAKQLSNEGKEHQRKMISLNKEASTWIYIGQSSFIWARRSHTTREIDLHGLYVKEAIEHTDQALQEAKQRGDSEVHLIVGKGLHSQGGAAKIKPAIEELHQLSAELDPRNAGVLIVQMGTRQGGVGPDEIARRLERDDQGCTIM